MRKSCLACTAAIPEPFHWKELLSGSLFRPRPYPPLEEWICADCREKLELITGEGCALCSRPLANLDGKYIHPVQGKKVCHDCLYWQEWAKELGLSQVLTGNRSAIIYNDLAKRLIYRYKFQGDERLKYFFASLLISLSKDNYILKEVDLVVGIPLTDIRLKERGFNQAAQLARLFAEHYGLAYAEDVLIRLPDDGRTQSKKSRKERLTDLLQKFIKNPQPLVDINNKNILLIDDVYTTGATLHAAAYTLLKAGVHKVRSLTVAR